MGERMKAQVLNWLSLLCTAQDTETLDTYTKRLL